MERKRPAAQQGRPPGSEMTAFANSLTKSLEKNRELQLQILSMLESLNGKMAVNRRMASRLTRELHMENEKMRSVKPRKFAQGDVTVVKSLLKAGGEGKDESEVEDDAAVDPVEQAKLHEQELAKKNVKENWSADPYRPWKRQMFEDHLGKTPKSNEEAVKRRRIELQYSGEHLFPHLTPLWDAQQKKLFNTFLQRQSTDEENVIDFEAAAAYINEKRKVDVDNPFRQPRTAKECELQYARQQAEKQPKITKAETKQIVEQVKQMGKEGKIDWEAIAAKIGNNRTPWQCFVAHQKSLYTGSSHPNWTPQQDEMILKYIAAQGPQFVLETGAVEDMCNRLFPDKTRKQMFLRANHSLVNPNLQSSGWNLDEERKLALCRKIYKDASDQVSLHFPTRSSRAVREKWSKTLDPSYSSRPWTKEEDEKLMQAVRQQLENATGSSSANHVGTAISWADIGKEHFPDRRPELIRHRWIQDLSTEEEMLQKIKADLAASQGIEGGEDAPQLDNFEVKVVRRGRKKK